MLTLRDEHGTRRVWSGHANARQSLPHLDRPPSADGTRWATRPSTDGTSRATRPAHPRDEHGTRLSLDRKGAWPPWLGRSLALPKQPGAVRASPSRCNLARRPPGAAQFGACPHVPKPCVGVRPPISGSVVGAGAAALAFAVATVGLVGGATSLGPCGHTGLSARSTRSQGLGEQLGETVEGGVAVGGLRAKP
jgi:hypothetical protein